MRRHRIASWGDEQGFSLLEVLVAAGLFTVGLVALAELCAMASCAARVARTNTFAAVLAAQRMEDLRGLAWGYDADGVAVADTTTNLAARDQPGCPSTSAGGGTGLSFSPGGALRADLAGWVDYLDASGCVVEGPDAAAGATYVRRWAVDPLPSSPEDGLVLRVMVAARQPGRRPDGAEGASMPGYARLLSVRVRRRP